MQQQQQKKVYDEQVAHTHLSCCHVTKTHCTWFFIPFLYQTTELRFQGEKDVLEVQIQCSISHRECTRH